MSTSVQQDTISDLDGDGCGDNKSAGRWTAEEHSLFLQGLAMYQKQWKQIAELVKTRTVVQIRTHAQKYFQKLHKANGGIGKADKYDESNLFLDGDMVRKLAYNPTESRTTSIGSSEGTEVNGMSENHDLDSSRKTVNMFGYSGAVTGSSSGLTAIGAGGPSPATTLILKRPSAATQQAQGSNTPGTTSTTNATAHAAVVTKVKSEPKKRARENAAAKNSSVSDLKFTAPSPKKSNNAALYTFKNNPAPPVFPLDGSLSSRESSRQNSADYGFGTGNEALGSFPMGFGSGFYGRGFSKSGNSSNSTSLYVPSSGLSTNGGNTNTLDAMADLFFSSHAGFEDELLFPSGGLNNSSLFEDFEDDGGDADPLDGEILNLLDQVDWVQCGIPPAPSTDSVASNATDHYYGGGFQLADHRSHHDDHHSRSLSPCTDSTNSGMPSKAPSNTHLSTYNNMSPKIVPNNPLTFSPGYPSPAAPSAPLNPFGSPLMSRTNGLGSVPGTPGGPSGVKVPTGLQLSRTVSAESDSGVHHAASAGISLTPTYNALSQPPNYSPVVSSGNSTDVEGGFMAEESASNSSEESLIHPSTAAVHQVAQTHEQPLPVPLPVHRMAFTSVINELKRVTEVAKSNVNESDADHISLFDLFQRDGMKSVGRLPPLRSILPRSNVVSTMGSADHTMRADGIAAMDALNMSITSQSALLNSSLLSNSAVHHNQNMHLNTSGSLNMSFTTTGSSQGGNTYHQHHPHHNDSLMTVSTTSFEADHDSALDFDMSNFMHEELQDAGDHAGHENASFESRVEELMSSAWERAPEDILRLDSADTSLITEGMHLRPVTAGGTGALPGSAANTPSQAQRKRGRPRKNSNPSPSADGNNGNLSTSPGPPAGPVGTPGSYLQYSPVNISTLGGNNALLSSPNGYSLVSLAPSNPGSPVPPGATSPGKNINSSSSSQPNANFGSSNGTMPSPLNLHRTTSHEFQAKFNNSSEFNLQEMRGFYPHHRTFSELSETSVLANTFNTGFFLGGGSGNGLDANTSDSNSAPPAATRSVSAPLGSYLTSFTTTSHAVATQETSSAAFGSSSLPVTDTATTTASSTAVAIDYDGGEYGVGMLEDFD